MTATPKHTPWGAPQTVKELAPGVVKMTTSSHGGIWVAPERMGEMVIDASPWNRNSWFEEDCDWAFVAVSFPELFDGSVDSAKSTIRNAYSGKYAHLVA